MVVEYTGIGAWCGPGYAADDYYRTAPVPLVRLATGGWLLR